MSMENLPKKEIVLVSAAAVATGIGAAALGYILKRRKEGKVIFVENIDQETADLLHVVPTAPDNPYLDGLVSERYDGEPTDLTKKESAE